MAIGYEAVKVDNTHKRYWNIEAKDAETRMTQKLEHECWNTDAGTRMTQMLKHKCRITVAETQMLEHEC
jgi:hypothetical protein